MAKLVWDKPGEHFFETGVSNVALYLADTSGEEVVYTNGVAWNGITSVQESPSGADANDRYADNVKYLSLRAAEDFGCTIEAYTYPDEWMQCDGSAELAEGVYVGQQTRQTFGLAYKTQLGNDVVGSDYGYKLHLVYGATASPSDRSYETINDSPDAITFSWEITTIPVAVTGFKPTAYIEIDSTKVNKDKLAAFEKILFGDESGVPTLPLPDAVKAAFVG